MMRVLFFIQGSHKEIRQVMPLDKAKGIVFQCLLTCEQSCYEDNNPCAPGTLLSFFQASREE